MTLIAKYEIRAWTSKGDNATPLPIKNMTSDRIMIGDLMFSKWDLKSLVEKFPPINSGGR